MKKAVPFVCIFIALMTVFVCLAYMPQGHQPSEIAINSAVFWAESYVGQSKFPFSDGTGTSESLGWSPMFVSNTYGVASVYSLTAHLFWLYTDNQHPRGLERAPGQPGVFRQDGVQPGQRANGDQHRKRQPD